MRAAEAYRRLKEHSVRTAYFISLGALASWDQRTMIPPKGHQHRAGQLAELARLVHRRRSDPRVQEWLQALQDTEAERPADSDISANVREWRRIYQRVTRVPEDLAVALAQAESEGESAWEVMKAKNDWRGFKPFLKRLLVLKKEYAEAVGYQGEPYDALLQDYEPGENTANLITLFSRLREASTNLLERIEDSPQRPRTDVLRGSFPLREQRRFIRETVARLGYDLEAGRIDPTSHPFELSVGPGDSRIAVRCQQEHFAPGFFGAVHEAGHAIYEQGLSADDWGTPLGSAVSLGVHESQSRLWENVVGRSLGFWRFFFPRAQEHFEGLRGITLNDFHAAVNAVRPSLIRVEADEVTYNLHILIRFELELALFRGELEVEDLPAAWNEKHRQYLGLTPRDYAQGVMQDVHWAAGQVGYFPTYTLGNVYAAQLAHKAAGELGDLQGLFAKGEFAPLLLWLRENVHRHGSRYLPKELIAQASGEPPNVRYLIDYLNDRFATLYAL